MQIETYNTRINENKLKKYFQNNGVLWLLALPGLIYLVLFLYVPMAGLVVVFKNYNFQDGIFGSPWVGLKNFDFFFYNFSKALLATKNTIFLNILYIVFGTIVSVGLAIMFNEVRSRSFKKAAHSISIFPYMISWVVAGNILSVFLDYNKGVINQVLTSIGLEKMDFNSNPVYWPLILTIMFIWKMAGYNSIIYYAVLTNLDTTYYEAAEIDGASILQKTWYVSIPFLKPTVILLTLLSIGRIFYGDLTMMVGLTNLNPMLIPTTEIIDTFVYRSVIRNGQFAMAAAIGLYQSIFGFVMVLLANYMAGRFNKDYRIF